jgi:hypothetical protein
MPDAHGNAVNCAAIQQALRQSPGPTHTLTAAESAHVEGCDACLEAWLDTTVTKALNTKPDVRIPSRFAARIAAQIPPKRGASAAPRSLAPGYERHWGLLTAILLVASGLLAAAFADPGGLRTRMGVIFMLLVASEIAGIALWLGTGRPGERRS